MALKHVGRIKKTKRKVVVAYRVVPNDADFALVVQTENLDAGEHDALMTAVESDAGQSAYEFGEAMARTMLPDGRNMLAGFHKTGKLNKIESEYIEMTPDNKTVIGLDELNKVIAEQKGVTVEDLALTETEKPAEAPAAPAPTAEPASDVLTDEDLAKQYRSQADALFKEAKKLREQAEELSPTKRSSKKAAMDSA